MTKLTFFFYEKSMGNESKLSEQFAGQSVSLFHITLPRQQEGRQFTIGTRHYKNRADFDANLKNESFAGGLSLFDVIRVSDKQIAIRYTRPADYYSLLYISCGDMKGEYTIRLLMDDDKKHHIEFYRAQLHDYCELRGINAAFAIEDNPERNIIRAKVMGLANACHMRQIHIKGIVIRHVEDMDSDHYIERRIPPLELPPPLTYSSSLRLITYQPPAQDNI